MNRLIEKIVFSGLVTACRFATWPTSRSPSLVKATTDGVVRAPSWLTMTVGSPPSIAATTELVVPRSIPIIFVAMLCSTMPRWPRGMEQSKTRPAIRAQNAEQSTRSAWKGRYVQAGSYRGGGGRDGRHARGAQRGRACRREIDGGRDPKGADAAAVLRRLRLPCVQVRQRDRDIDGLRLRPGAQARRGARREASGRRGSGCGQGRRAAGVTNGR